MKTVVTRGIVLARTNYQEADRIITILTPDQGKIRVMAKGVRRQKSKMAGGIELFSVGDITYLPGKGDLGTLISSRLIEHYGNIVKDISRTMRGYEFLGQINKVTEAVVEEEFFTLLCAALKGLNDAELSLELSELWFNAQLLRISGHTPNLLTDTAGHKLMEDKNYEFSWDDTAFREVSSGPFTSRDIKLMRLAFNVSDPIRLKNVKDAGKIIGPAHQLIDRFLTYHI